MSFPVNLAHPWYMDVENEGPWMVDLQMAAAPVKTLRLIWLAAVQDSRTVVRVERNWHTEADSRRT